MTPIEQTRDLSQLSDDELGALIDPLLEPHSDLQPITPEIQAMAEEIFTQIDLEGEFSRIAVLTESEKRELGKYAAAVKRVLGPVVDDYVNRDKTWRESGMRIFQDRRRELRGALPATIIDGRESMLDQIDMFLTISMTQQKMLEKQLGRK